MPRRLKVWLAVWGLTLLAILTVGLWNWIYAAGLFASIVHADFAIAYWLKYVDKWTAILIAIVIGNAALYNMFWVGDQVVPFLNWLAKKFPAFQKIWRVREENEALQPSYPNWLLKMSYTALPLFPIDPYLGASFGIFFSKKLRLKTWLSFLLMASGNSLKMVAIGLWMSALSEPARLLMTAILVAAIIVVYCFKNNPQRKS